MSLLRKDRVNLGRVNLSGILEVASLTTLLEPYINRFIDLFEDEGVVLPVEEFSPDPEDGELLFNGSELYLAIDGSYHRVYPADGTGSAGTTDGSGSGDGSVACDYTSYVEDVKWAQEDCAINTSTDVVDAVAGKRLCIVYLEFSNLDTTDGKSVYLTLEDDSTNYFKKWIPSEGVVVQNFTRANPIAGVGKKISATVSNNGSSAISVTVGYLELDEV